MDLRDVKEFLIDTIKYLLTAVIVIFVILYVVTIQQVIGPSMSPTLDNKDLVLLSRSHYRFFKMKRFDVIAFEYVDTKYLIKRVIGLPGDKLEFRNNNLYVNDKIVEEKFLNGQKTADFSLIEMGYKTIPEGKYFVLGDNRDDSLDSRSFGLIDEKDILGKVSFKIWPIFEFSLI